MTPTNEKETKSLMRVSKRNASIAIQRLGTALLKRVVQGSNEQLVKRIVDQLVEY